MKNRAVVVFFMPVVWVCYQALRTKMRPNSSWLTSLLKKPRSNMQSKGGNLPTRMALYSDAEIAESWPGFDTLAEQLPYGVFAPQFTWFEEWRQSAATAVQDVISGSKTSAEAIEWLAEESARIKAD